MGDNRHDIVHVCISSHGTSATAATHGQQVVYVLTIGEVQGHISTANQQMWPDGSYMLPHVLVARRSLLETNKLQAL